MKKIICLLLITAFVLSSCEKDDICDPSTPTTPRLIIQFFDINNQSVSKAPRNLKIIGEGMNDVPVINTRGTEIWNDTLIYVPLRINEDASKFRFIINADDDIATNDLVDTLEFNYSRRDVYVSRACGFKTIFDLNGIPTADPFVLNNDPDATVGQWIRFIEVEQPNLNDENETHINIYFFP